MRRILAPVFSASVLSLLAGAAHAAPSFYWANPRPTGAELGGVDFESATVGYAVGGFGTCLRTTDGGVTWEDRTNLGTLGPSLDDVLVLSPGVLLAAGSSPGIHRSTDGGFSWSPVTNPASAHLRNLFALDAATIFAIGDAGRVIRSTDGGGTWSLLSVPVVTSLVDQWWLDAQNAYVLGQNCVRRTTNGGTSWSAIAGIPESSAFFLGDVQFTDPQNGWILLDFDTYHSTNGGTTWAKIPAAFGQSPIYQEEAIFFDSQTRIVATEAEGAYLWKTTNNGANWTLLFRHLGTRGVTDLERLPDGAIVATTTDGDLLRSTDDGASWSDFTQVAGPPSRENTSVMDVHPSGLGFAGGYGACWMQTTDSGRTWFTPSATPGLGGAFAITIRDALFALAGGSGTPGHSDVRRTTDGGATWTTHDLAPGYVGYPQGLAAFEDGTCFCATYGGQGINFIYRSTDSGSTWQLRNNGAGGRFFDLFFLDSQRGFVCGGEFSNPTIFRTTDGGGLWTPVGETGLAGSEMRDMHWFDLDHGFVVDGNALYRTTDGGGSWTAVSGTGAGEAIDFLDAQHGVVSVYPNNASLTSDGGVTWNPVALPIPGYVSDVAMIATGFLVSGGSNEILGYDTGLGAVAVPEIARSSALAPASLVVWPNPVRLGESSALSFRIVGGHLADGNAASEARLYDVGGRLLARSALGAGAQAGSVSLDSVELLPGVVFLEVRAAGGNRLGSKVAVIR